MMLYLCTTFGKVCLYVCSLYWAFDSATKDEEIEAATWQDIDCYLIVQVRNASIVPP